MINNAIFQEKIKMRESASRHPKTPGLLSKMSSETTKLSDEHYGGKPGCMYRLKCVVNAVSSLVLIACGIALCAIGWRTHGAPMHLGHGSISLCGGVLLLLALPPVMTLLNWVNMHWDYHEASARQARWELEHQVEQTDVRPTSSHESTDTTIVQIVEDGLGADVESLPPPLPLPKKPGHETVTVTQTELIKVQMDGNPLDGWDGKGLPSFLDQVPLDKVGQLRYSGPDETIQIPP